MSLKVNVPVSPCSCNMVEGVINKEIESVDEQPFKIPVTVYCVEPNVVGIKDTPPVTPLFQIYVEAPEPKKKTKSIFEE